MSPLLRGAGHGRPTTEGLFLVNVLLTRAARALTFRSASCFQIRTVVVRFIRESPLPAIRRSHLVETALGIGYLQADRSSLSVRQEIRTMTTSCSTAVHIARRSGGVLFVLGDVTDADVVAGITHGARDRELDVPVVVVAGRKARWLAGPMAGVSYLRTVDAAAVVGRAGRSRCWRRAPVRHAAQPGRIHPGRHGPCRRWRPSCDRDLPCLRRWIGIPTRVANAASSPYSSMTPAVIPPSSSSLPLKRNWDPDALASTCCQVAVICVRLVVRSTTVHTDDGAVDVTGDRELDRLSGHRQHQRARDGRCD